MGILSKIQELIEKSIKGSAGNDLYVDFSKISNTLNFDLKTFTDEDFSGYVHSIDQSGVIHSLKHKNIKPSDILLIPYIV